MSFSTVRQPETSPSRFMSASKPSQMSVVVANQLCLNLSSCKDHQSVGVQLGPKNEADGICDELEFHITVDSK